MPALATVFAAPGTVTLVAASAVAVLFIGLWAVSLVISDVSIVDPVWGPAFVLVALACLIAGDAHIGSGGQSRRIVLFVMTALWGLRLGGYLLVRKLGDPGEDRRYTKMRDKRGATFPLYSLLSIFGSQGLLVLIVSLPLQVAAERRTGLQWFAWVGVALWAVGLFFEGVGDEQMRRFKAREDSKGQVMNHGLWGWTRHPNYFGDFCVWWGLWLVALCAGGTWWTVIGPLVMSFLLIKGSGAALLEKDISERRPKYADYIKQTPAFFPRPPRRSRPPRPPRRSP